MKKILIAEDEIAIREFEVINLQRAGYQIIETGDGKEAVDIFISNKDELDIVILDLMLPSIDGMNVCKEIRKLSDSIGIIILTAKSQEIDKISGLMYGADDYITKPFSPSELLARVDALYRRVSAITQRNQNSFNDEIKFGEFILSLRKHTLFKNGTEIPLTQVEFQIIEYFFSNPDTALTRKQILNHVWGSGGGFDEKIVDVNIRRIRMKIEDKAGPPNYILTVWGIGYKLNKFK